MTYKLSAIISQLSSKNHSVNSYSVTPRLHFIQVKYIYMSYPIFHVSKSFSGNFQTQLFLLFLLNLLNCLC